MSIQEANAIFERIVADARGAPSLTGNRFNQLLDSILKVDASNPGKQADFYHGTDNNGTSNFENARSNANENSYRLDETPLGPLLERAFDAKQEGELTDYEYKGLVDVASAKFTL